MIILFCTYLKAKLATFGGTLRITGFCCPNHTWKHTVTHYYRVISYMGALIYYWNKRHIFRQMGSRVNTRDYTEKTFLPKSGVVLVKWYLQRMYLSGFICERSIRFQRRSEETDGAALRRQRKIQTKRQLVRWTGSLSLCISVMFMTLFLAFINGSKIEKPMALNWLCFQHWFCVSRGLGGSQSMLFSCRLGEFPCIWGRLQQLPGLVQRNSFLQVLS